MYIKKPAISRRHSALRSRDTTQVKINESTVKIMPVNIAVDGPSGAGKSTIARRAAKALGYLYVDTGAIYRSVALYCLEHSIDVNSAKDVSAALTEISPELRYIDGEQHTFVNGEDVSARIRTPQVSMSTSTVSAIPEVRAFLFDLQQSLAKKNNVIMDGRDIGTAVLPDADLKIFLTASPEERARRRLGQLEDQPNCPSYEQVLADIIERDLNDTTRAVSPLRQAPDAVVCDTTGMTLAESSAKIIAMIRSTVESGDKQ